LGFTQEARSKRHYIFEGKEVDVLRDEIPAEGTIRKFSQRKGCYDLGD